jgi:hypothetical protein
MAKFNTNGNAYTIIYASVMVIIVAFLLAFVASALKPTQDANVAIDKKSQILASLNIRGVETANVEDKYAEIVKADPIYSESAEVEKENGGFDVANKDIKVENRPLYICEVEGATKYVVPVKVVSIYNDNIYDYVDFEVVNIKKTVDAAQDSVDAINKLIKRGMLSELPRGFAETARLRVDNPFASLEELAEMHADRISKSGVNHRLKKMTMMAEDL